MWNVSTAKKLEVRATLIDRRWIKTRDAVESPQRPGPSRAAEILQDVLCELVLLSAVHPNNLQLRVALRQTEVALGRTLAATGFI